MTTVWQKLKSLKISVKCLYIQGYYKNLYGTEPFRINEIVLSDIHADNRIGWKDAMHICVKRFCNEQYEHPQCIGMCATDHNKG